MAKQDEYVRYTVRVPADLYRRLQERAGEKSINAEIVARLGASFEGLAVEELAQARSLIEELLRTAEYKRNDLAAIDADYRARLFLAGVPVKALEEFNRWSSPSFQSAAESLVRNRDAMMRTVQSVVDRALEPLVKYLRERGWTVEPPKSE